MRFGSVCSGIEAASVAWEPLGWKAAWFAEIEPFPSAVLKYHYADVPNHGDMTALPQRIRDGEVEAPDLFCGGTPCQAFSVAGLRKSLDDARGNLSLTFCEIANAIDHVRMGRGDQPCIVFWENVPGVLSTSDNAFGCFLGALAGCDSAIVPLAATGWTDAGVVDGPQRSVAWRILDAQYFGLAQRRRRVFVVASAREGFDPVEVLFEWEGLRRDTAPSREAGQGVANSLVERPDRGGGNSEGQRLITMAHGQGGAEISVDRGPTLTCNHEAPILAFDTYNQTISETAQTLCSRGDTPGGNAHLVSAVLAHAFDARQSDVIQYGDKTGPLDTDGHSVAVAVRTANTSANGHGISAELAHTLDQAQGQAVLAPTLTATNDPSRSPQSSEITAQVAAITAAAMQVRRLTPVECERLQGFPDHYTAIPWRGKPASECPDGPRYKALGNSWAMPCVRWIGRRIHNAVYGRAA